MREQGACAFPRHRDGGEGNLKSKDEGGRMKAERSLKVAMLINVKSCHFSIRYLQRLMIVGVFTASVVLFAGQAIAQNTQEQPKKSNERPPAAAMPTPSPEPFDGASVEKMASQCVKLDTEAGEIEIEMLAEVAPENVRNFLNLAATGMFDTTTFSRVVKDFVIQGGNLSTGQKWSLETARRAARKVPDEPSYVKHERGIVSMARPDEPNSATTHFFILLNTSSQLDGKFSAFGRVTRGMDVVEAINKAPAEGEKPAKAVVIKRAIVEMCEKKTQ
jgi:peptidyl-prolyl cis-trans isomerase B (cyclophilin B)